MIEVIFFSLSDINVSTPTLCSPLGRGVTPPPPSAAVLMDSSREGYSGSPNSVAPHMPSSHSSSLLPTGSSGQSLVTHPTDANDSCTGVSASLPTPTPGFPHGNGRGMPAPPPGAVASDPTGGLCHCRGVILPPSAAVFALLLASKPWSIGRGVTLPGVSASLPARAPGYPHGRGVTPPLMQMLPLLFFW